jgi:hypothetical protein
MQKIKVLSVLLVCSFFSVWLFSALPMVQPGNAVEEPTAETASILIILDIWRIDIGAYKEICSEPKLSLEEFNLMAVMSSKSGVPMSQIWKWRKMKIEWQSILKRIGLTLEDVVPRSEKKWGEPYQFCYSYWREKGDPKKVFLFSDYNFEKLGEIMTLAKYSEKSVDTVIEEMTKGGSFRELSLKYYKEKTKKTKRR